MRVINQALKFNRLPSEIINIKDEYTAFCFNEACLLIINQLEENKPIRWKEDTLDKNGKEKTFLSEHFKKKGGKVSGI